MNISHSVSLMIFFLDNPRNEGGIRAEAIITTPIVTATTAEGEGTAVDVPNRPAVESQVVVEGRPPIPVGEFFFLYCAISIGLNCHILVKGIVRV